MENGSSRTTAVIPNLITIGNAVCGFVALTLIAGSQIYEGELSNPHNLRNAAWFILAGMVFDVFDGRVARITGNTSGLGAQLDSLADLVTFGLAPAGLVVVFHRTIVASPPWEKIVWIFGLAYFLGAMLRLARFNSEHDPGEEYHLCFRGLPTPAAAGTIASLVLVYFWLSDWKSWELRALAVREPAFLDKPVSLIPILLPFLCFILGYTMVSGRLQYPHLASRLLSRRHSFDLFVYLIFGGILTAFLVEPVLCIAFLAYVLWTPIGTVAGLVGRRRERKRE